MMRRPVHRVRVAPFRLCRFQVTNAHWEAFRKAAGRDEGGVRARHCAGDVGELVRRRGVLPLAFGAVGLRGAAAHRSRMGIRGARRAGGEALSRGAMSRRACTGYAERWRNGPGAGGGIRSRTATGFSTCARTCTSGARTGTTRGTTRCRRRKIRTGRSGGREGRRAAGRGGTISSSRGARREAASRRSSGTRIMGSGWGVADRPGDASRGVFPQDASQRRPDCGSATRDTEQSQFRIVITAESHPCEQCTSPRQG